MRFSLFQQRKENEMKIDEQYKEQMSIVQGPVRALRTVVMLKTRFWDIYEPKLADLDPYTQFKQSINRFDASMNVPLPCNKNVVIRILNRDTVERTDDRSVWIKEIQLIALAVAFVGTEVETRMKQYMKHPRNMTPNLYKKLFADSFLGYFPDGLKKDMEGKVPSTLYGEINVDYSLFAENGNGRIYPTDDFFTLCEMMDFIHDLKIE